jgi:hypothetical protein
MALRIVRVLVPRARHPPLGFSRIESIEQRGLRVAADRVHDVLRLL